MDSIAADAKRFADFHSISRHPVLSKEARAGYIAALVYSDRRAPASLQAMKVGDLVSLVASVLP